MCIKTNYLTYYDRSKLGNWFVAGLMLVSRSRRRKMVIMMHIKKTAARIAPSCRPSDRHPCLQSATSLYRVNSCWRMYILSHSFMKKVTMT